MPTFVYYEPATGEILYTAKYTDPTQASTEPHIEIGDTVGMLDLGDWKVENGALASNGMDGYRKWGAEGVDTAVSIARKLFITDITGQQMIYLRKETEANDYLATPELLRDINDYPFIKGESEALNQAALTVATTFKARADAWIAVGAALEKARLSRKAAITAAVSTTEIDSEVAGIATDVAAILAAAGA